MKKLKIPVVEYFNQNPIGILVIDKDNLPKGVDYRLQHYRLQLGFKILEKEVTKDGKTIIRKIEPIEIILVYDKNEKNKIYSIC